LTKHLASRCVIDVTQVLYGYKWSWKCCLTPRLDPGMPNILGLLNWGWSGARPLATKAQAPLQTVQEQAERERWALPPEGPPSLASGGPVASPSSHQYQSEPEPGPDRKSYRNLSGRPLSRTALKDQLGADYGHVRLQAAAAEAAAAKRAVYIQEGDVEPGNDFKQTVADLLKEEEYGVLRLVVPHISLSREQFDRYVRWLNQQKQQQRRRQQQHAAGGTAKKADSLPRSLLGLPVVPPYHPLSLAWMSFMTAVDLTWTAFGVPVNVAFCSINYGHLRSACTATDLAFGAVYAANLLTSFQLGLMVVSGHRKKAVLDGRRLAHYYVMYGRFPLDLAAVVPFVYLLVVLGLSGGQGYRSKWVNALSLIRLVRLLRLVSVSKVIYIDSAVGSEGWLSRYLSLSRLHVALVAFQTIVLINLVACILVLLAYMRGLEHSWMTAVSWTDLVDASRAYQWYCAMYWVITSATTTG
ncbi:hypothetical protein Agub_g5199, partial [Astrephomene gubernaculifera]